MTEPVEEDAEAENTRGAFERAGLSELMSDAHAVALFGQRTGKLPDNTLQNAIAAVRLKETPSWSDEETVKLQSALNEAVKAISPVTLLDLRRGWNPFNRSKMRSANVSAKNVLFLIFAFVLILSAGVSTFILNKGNTIVAALETLKELQPQRRIGELQRELLNAEPAVTTSQTPESMLAREVYFHALDDLRDIDQRLSMFIPASTSFESDYQNPIIFIKNMYGYLITGIWPQQTSYQSLPFNVSCNKALFAKMEQDFSNSTFGKKPLGIMFSHYQEDALDLFCYQGILYQPSMVPSLEERLGRLNQILGMYALWILPAIYGALGATIFFMRSVLDPLSPDPPPSKVFLRVALGALSGIILGWFWTPDTVFGNEIGKIGFSLFGMAFVFGFSIDVFFAMLDRFVSLGKDFFNRVGTKTSTE